MATSVDYGSLGFKDIIVTLDGAVAVVTMNRTKQRNTVSVILVGELIKAFELFDRDDRVRAVVVTADPKAAAYCSGADISKGWSTLWNEESDREGAHAHRDLGGTITLAILHCRKITVAAVNGHAAGVGMTAMQLPFDFRFAWEDAKLTFPFVRRGVAPEAVSSYLLPRLLGHSKATSLLLTAETVTPKHPHIRDIYHEIYPTRDEVFPAALAFAKELAANTGQVAIAISKGLLLYPGHSAEENHLLDSMGFKILGSNSDSQEGVKSFMERRAPKFTDTLSQNLPSWYPWVVGYAPSKGQVVEMSREISRFLYDRKATINLAMAKLYRPF